MEKYTQEQIHIQLKNINQQLDIQQQWQIVRADLPSGETRASAARPDRHASGPGPPSSGPMTRCQ